MAAFSSLHARPDSARQLGDLQSQAALHLEQDIMPFWADRSPDIARGGFITDLDRQGVWKKDDEKRLLMQVRLIWSFSAAHRFGLRNRDYLGLARSGIDFVEAHLKDVEQGGYFTACDGDGRVTVPVKSAYHLSFTIYAFSEHYLASGDVRSLALAEALFDVLQERARDPDGPGYLEEFEADWSLRDRSEVTGEPNAKTLNTHMHLMECFINLYRASGKEVHRKALLEVMDLIEKKMIHPAKEGLFAYEPYDRQLNPIPNHTGELGTSYSHNVELAWFYYDAALALGEDPQQRRDVILGLIDYALERGYDWERGGMAPMGPVRCSVFELDPLPGWVNKGWWDQAELMVALLYGMKLERKPAYEKALYQTWSLIWDHFIDWEFGEWYPYLDWHTLEPQADYKGSGWKTSYHNARALIKVAELSRSLEPR
jgi:mannobiose 2-epimerase